MRCWLGLLIAVALGTAPLLGQYPGPIASPKKLNVARAADSTLGVVQYRTALVRLTGSGIGHAWVGIELARNEWADGSTDFLLIFTIVDTLPFGTQPGTSLLLVLDGDSVALSGPGNVWSRVVNQGGIRSNRGPPPLGYKYGHQEMAPYGVSPELLERLARATNVSLRLHGSPWRTRQPTYLTRRMPKDGFALIRGFLIGWTGPAADTSQARELASYVPRD